MIESFFVKWVNMSLKFKQFVSILYAEPLSSRKKEKDLVGHLKDKQFTISVNE